MKPFEELLAESVKAHGHLCAGQVIGVRMAMLGCKLLGIDDPKSREWHKNIIVFIEIDRCMTDAIQSVTGCQLGRRTMKFKDFGISAATFLNLKTNEAWRVLATETSRDLAHKYAGPGVTDPKEAQLVGYQSMPDEELFECAKVDVKLDPWHMPGPPARKAICDACGQKVSDGREVERDNKVLCRICAGEAYFTPVQ